MTCIAAVTHSVNVHSYTIIDTNIDMKHPPYIKKNFVIELLLIYYIQVCYHYSMHCVMVARTANHCVMGR